MFGCIVAGRLVQTDLDQVGEHQFVFKIPEPQLANHIVVFLLGTIPFNPGYAATVHFRWPASEWKFLGIVSNEKPSAIFKVKNLAESAPEVETGLIAEVGISIEPENTVQIANEQHRSQLVLSKTTGTEREASASQKMLQSLFDYCMSFSTNLGSLSSNQPFAGLSISPQTQVIPSKVFQDWYKSYLSKLSKGLV
ncbi:Protein OPI10-like protein [Zancudomyces culisetae]|uniref:Protein OPI10-like protein n=1 Tax=Zancudomyces culisetae TaxID=1213189 RepID=A0A1R1PFJ2_ZANCU|nr:Protein OPI10-like protein [Zancudomyces culisetae]|eukprot:OMH79754.1 Protein OPI10-like protein [Zancudomyces culisetae]